MIIRTISAVVLFPILFFAVYFGGIYLKIGMIFISLAGMYEFYKAVQKKILPIHFLGFFAATVYLLVLDTIFFEISDLIFAVFLIFILIFMVFHHKTTSVEDVALTFFGVCYIPIMFSAIYLIRSFHFGNFTVWLPFLCAWSCDTGAYYVGITLGKHKLTPILSPKKTVEGSIGGILFSVVTCALYGIIVANKVMNIDFFMDTKASVVGSFAIIGFIGAIFSQLGDLTASTIKRKYNIKDYGKIIPGHGGILDRFDSVIFTGGVCYILLKIIENMHQFFIEYNKML